MIESAATFLSAGHYFREVLANVPSTAWNAPGLDDWTVRTLAGHTSRALSTVLTYLGRPAEKVQVESAADYYLATGLADDPRVTERAMAAGKELGAHPVDKVDRLLARLENTLPLAEDRIIETAAGGMRFRDYLPTRIFELAVHTLDLSRACGLVAELPGDVELEAGRLAIQIASERGDGAMVLLALTGRTILPGDFSVV
jgi:uncharacterized protein (TIGR03083 family)